MHKLLPEHEAKIYSQNGEDGIIAHIFAVIGTSNRTAVEIGVAANSQLAEANTYNLGTQGWRTYWFDCANTHQIPMDCVFTRALLTADNVVGYFERVNVPLEPDLISIDVDGNDYWLRAALAEYKPRVWVMEYNGCQPADSNYVMPRNDSYMWSYPQTEFGASLKALTEQANSFGYDLVYVDTQGVNAFYIRRDCNQFEPVQVEQAWKQVCWARTGGQP